MAVYRFSTLSDNQAISFDPESDRLYFDQTSMAAANVVAWADSQGLHVYETTSGKEVVLLGMSRFEVTTSNISFADGSRLLYGDNSLAGGDDGPNSLSGTFHDDHLHGWGGDDTLLGRGGADWLEGGNNDDRLEGGSGNDLLQGGDDQDTLYGDTGADTLYGGAGDDVYGVENPGDQVIEFEGGGSHDRVISSLDSYFLPARVEDLTLYGGARTGFGNELDNILTGTAGDNYLSGQDGNDRLAGLGGNDTFLGGAGDDTLVGGSGDDLYYIYDASDTIVERVDGGIDRVSVSFDYTLPAQIENLSLSSASGSIDGFGNALDNRISGGVYSNLIVGKGGDDTLSGGIDPDTLVGGLGADSFLFTSQPGRWNADVVRDFVPGTDRLELLNGTPPEPGDYPPGNHADYGEAGTLADDDARFYAAPGARSGHDADDRLVYDTTAGKLFYDPDGSGPDAPQLIYTLRGAPQLHASDITIVDSVTL
jgi:Ca2+-binding RTX toxin-like protein